MIDKPSCCAWMIVKRHRVPRQYSATRQSHTSRLAVRKAQRGLSEVLKAAGGSLSAVVPL
jgi:hypothetical protein